MLKDSHIGYGLITIIFHWLCAILIIALFSLGIYMSELDYYSPWYHKAPELHISLGLGLLALMLLRLIWRSINPTPTALPTINARTMKAASLVKIALYFLFFTLATTGYLITTAEGHAANFFNLVSIPATVELSSENVDRAGFIHEICAWSIIVVATLHAVAALFHHFVKRDRTLLRMLNPVKKIN